MADVEDVIDATTRSVIELLAPIGPIVAQPLMGTWGLFLEDRILGLVDAGVAYFRTTNASEARYLAAGSRPFRYRRADGGSTDTAFREVPREVLADRDRACAWAYEAAGAPPR